MNFGLCFESGIVPKQEICSVLESRLCILYFLHLGFDSFVHENRKSQFLGSESEVTKREYKPVKASDSLCMKTENLRFTV